MARPQHHSGIKWKFETARFTVTLEIERDHNHRYDGDDENGETQSALNSGAYIAFDSTVTVELDGEVIGRDTLGASVYARETVAEFWTAHRDTDAMNRNCSIMRAARGANVCIGHYFPDMVSEAISAARSSIAQRREAFEALPHMRVGA